MEKENENKNTTIETTQRSVSDSDIDIDIDSAKERGVCEKCKGTGKLLQSNGLYVRCSCQNNNNNNNNNHNTTNTATSSYDLNKKPNRDYIQQLSTVIPYTRLSDEFDISYYKRVVQQMQRYSGFRLSSEGDYLGIVNKLLAEASKGKILHSYLLGAPNGFGKTTMVYTVYKRLIANNKKVVPYVSLSELARLLRDYESYIYNAGRISASKEPVIGIYTIQDWYTADFVAVKLTTLESKKAESSVLLKLLGERGNRGLPTLVTTENSLETYLCDIELRNLFWEDIMSYSGEDCTLDRLTHHSTYRIYY
jgi:hypothetical protein